MFLGDFKKENVPALGFRISVVDDRGKELARAYLYVMKNDLHGDPFGFIEDVFVYEFARGHGVSKKLLSYVIEVAKQEGCYKLVANSRITRPIVHKIYEDLGFSRHGYEFVLRWDLDILK